MQEQPHEDLLRGVLGIVLVAHQAVANPPHPIAMTTDQQGEGGSVGSITRGFGD
jgi:hypothetical protein